MKVLVDLQGAQGFGSSRGIGRYSLELSRALFELNLKELDFYFLINLSATQSSDIAINYLREFCPPEKIKGFSLQFLMLFEVILAVIFAPIWWSVDP